MGRDPYLSPPPFRGGGPGGAFAFPLPLPLAPTLCSRAGARGSAAGSGSASAGASVSASASATASASASVGLLAPGLAAARRGLPTHCLRGPRAGANNKSSSLFPRTRRRHLLHAAPCTGGSQGQGGRDTGSHGGGARTPLAYSASTKHRERGVEHRTHTQRGDTRGEGRGGKQRQPSRQAPATGHRVGKQ